MSALRATGLVQNVTVKVNPRSKFEENFPIGAGERVRWKYAISRFDIKLAAWFRPYEPLPLRESLSQTVADGADTGEDAGKDEPPPSGSEPDAQSNPEPEPEREDAGAAEPQPEPEPEPEAGALPEGVPVVDEPNQQVIMQAGDFLRNGSYSYHSMKHELIAIFGKEEFDKSKREVTRLLQDAHDKGEIAERAKEAAAEQIGKLQPKIMIVLPKLIGDPKDADKGGITQGSWLAPSAGTVFFELDNSYSKFRPKRVTYDVEVANVPGSTVEMQLPSLEPLLRKTKQKGGGGLICNDHMQVVSTDDHGEFAEGGVAPGMTLTRVNGKPVQASSWAALESQLRTAAEPAEGHWMFTFEIPDSSDSLLAIEEATDLEALKREAELKELANKIKLENMKEIEAKSGTEAATPSWMRTAEDRIKGGVADSGAILLGETSEEVRPWVDRLRDATAAYQGQQIVNDSSRRFRQAVREQRAGAGQSMFGRVTRRAGGPEINAEACGLAAQQLRQAAEQYAKAGQYQKAGQALETKAMLHEKQQLPDAQVAALLAAAEQYRSPDDAKPIIAQALSALDQALDVRLTQTRAGKPRALKQAQDVQRTIMETHRQARNWEKAAEAQLKLEDLRNGNIPALPGEELPVPDGGGNGGEGGGGGAEGGAPGTPGGESGKSRFSSAFASARQSATSSIEQLMSPDIVHVEHGR